MKAIVFDAAGGPELLRVAEVDDPSCGPDDVIVRNFATALNRADLLQRRGRYPPPPGESAILGLEFAGEILELGDVARSEGAVAVGDRVFGLLAGGGYAERVSVDHRMLLPIPDSLSYEKAAAIPEAYFTAQKNLVTHGRLAPGERVLIHAGASGVGTAAIQLARLHGCAAVLVTARSAEKVARCLELGVDRGWDSTVEDVSACVLEATDGEGVDVILDCIGGSVLGSNLGCLRRGGRLVVIGLLGGARAEIDLSGLLMRNLTIVGSAMRGLPLEEKIAVTARFRESVLPAIADGRLEPVIDRVFLLEEARAAHERMESNLNTGKIVLRF